MKLTFSFLLDPTPLRSKKKHTANLITFILIYSQGITDVREIFIRILMIQVIVLRFKDTPVF